MHKGRRQWKCYRKGRRASVGVKAAPAISNVPIVGWLLAGLVTMVAQDKGSEIGGDVAKNYNDC